MNTRNNSIVKQRQDPLRNRYLEAPEEAAITDSASVSYRGGVGPFHGTVKPGQGHDAALDFGIHRVIGGMHDAPNPGDMLCAALGACLSSTLRIIADRLAVQIEELDVKITGNVDARGTLMVDPKVQVGFQQFQCSTTLRLAADTDPQRAQAMLAAAEHSCVVLQTLRNGVSVQTDFQLGQQTKNPEDSQLVIV